MDATPPPSLTPTNWSLPLNVGDYRTRYLLRALVAKNALGANRPQDAVYGYGTHDSAGTSDSNRLNSTQRYVLHFKTPTNQKAPLEIPPIDGNGFWSITLYNADGTLVDTKAATYHALSTKQVEGHSACLNDDKSLDICVQATPPSDSKQLCDWLEAPQPTTENQNGQKVARVKASYPNAALFPGCSWLTGHTAEAEYEWRSSFEENLSSAIMSSRSSQCLCPSIFVMQAAEDWFDDHT